MDHETAKELRRIAVEWLNDPAHTYTRLKDIDASLLMTPGFLNAWYAKRKVLLGPDRDITYITIVGPTACGKSYAAHNLFLTMQSASTVTLVLGSLMVMLLSCSLKSSMAKFLFKSS